MNQPDPIDVLNRLLRTLCRSLPVYLVEVKPWLLEHDDRARAIETIADEQLRMAQRVAEAVRQQGGHADMGGFPAEFTSKHDLATDHLLKDAGEHQQRDLAAIEQCVAQLQRAPFLQALAKEALGHARGQLENLEEGMKDEG